MSDKFSTTPLDEKFKHRIRRVKANGRERQRMHGLNNALDTIRRCMPISTVHQKLSKIETLKLARNYIAALHRTLQSPAPLSPLELAHMLAPGMSQTTTNMIATHYQVQPRQLLQYSQLRSESVEPSVGHPDSSWNSPPQVPPCSAYSLPVSPQYHVQDPNQPYSSFETNYIVPEYTQYAQN